MPKEQTYRTTSDELVSFTRSRIEQLPANVDYVKVTHDGKLQIALSSEALSNEVLDKIRDLLLIQQGQVFVDFEGAQQELPL